MKKPNIVLFLCDDLGWGDISCLNDESKIQTPNIDSFAENGFNFENAHAPSAVCTPSRYSTLTGRYCWRTKNLKQNVNSGYSPGLIKEGRKTIATELKNIGYQTACMGKWHIGMDWELLSGDQPEQELEKTDQIKTGERIDFSKPVKNGVLSAGFEHFYGISASLDMPPYAWMKNNQLIDMPTEIYPALEDEKRTAKGHGAPEWHQERVLPTIIEKSCSYIKQAAKSDKPYFLYLPINGPHTPVVPNKKWQGKSGCGCYGDFVMEIDDEFGKVLKAIKETGEEDNTIVIFTSDNGPETITMPYAEKYNHKSAWNFRGFKRDNWEGGHRVPMIVRWPTKKNNKKINNYIELTDIAATLSEITGVEVAEDFCEDSFSFLPIMDNKESPQTRELTVHHSVQGKWALRRGKWKILLHAGSGGNDYPNLKDDSPVQIYDMEKDPFEQNNLYPEQKELIEEMRMLCLQLIAKGRSTPGPEQPVEMDGDWQQVTDLLNLKM